MAKSTRKEENNRNVLTLSVGQAKQFIRTTLSMMPPDEAPAIITIGEVGIGKTEIWAQVAKDLKMSLVPRHLAQTHPLDMGAAGLDTTTREMYFAKSPIVVEVEAQPAPRIAFFDEYDRANPMVQSATLQLLTERKINGHKLADTYVGAAANAWYAQYTNELDKAAASRFVFLHVESNRDEWLRDYAVVNGVHPSIVVTIAMAPDIFNQHSELPDGAIKKADPRAWATLSRALNYGLDPAYAAGYIGEHAARVFSQYVNFAKDYSKEIAQVLKGKQLTKPGGTEAATWERLLFGVYLAAAGQVEHLPQAATFLENAVAQLGDEKAYISGRLLTYRIPDHELLKDKKIAELHSKMLAEQEAA